MPRIGIVIETTGQSARVSAPRRGVCDGCADRSSCSFENALGQDKPEMGEVYNPIDAQPGQTVQFDLPGHTELELSLLVWVVPLIGLVAGAALLASLHEQLSLGQDSATLLGAGLGFAAAFLPVVLCDRLSVGKTRYVPSILKVVSPSSCSASVRAADPPG